MRSRFRRRLIFSILILMQFGCAKNSSPPVVPSPIPSKTVATSSVDNVTTTNALPDASEQIEVIMLKEKIKRLERALREQVQAKNEEWNRYADGCSGDYDAAPCAPYAETVRNAWDEGFQEAMLALRDGAIGLESLGDKKSAAVDAKSAEHYLSNICTTVNEVNQ